MSQSWTKRQNALFESALAVFEKDTADRWQNVARAVGDGKSAEDVKRHYEELEKDVEDMESAGGRQGSDNSVSGASSSNSNSWGSANEDRRGRNLNLQ
ncbi:protein RADIALIS-like 4 [Brachypodium distachyon]|uniref:SANT domain-containing protein n=1 Tax=Brachypodium distachyon TaxID=15368 RepID=I1ID14_BRADI|nr:protein RADIALIS-like 4 [Brachypodium distachyon]KQK00946.1 hypothetical protein BRADI_3g52807v3 [Brachypodium distachyon]KQK00947.1 hypothetical protein BRADI_3g52807v3 [Brachypodium distachyon]PNT69287.1 hypothetical protein BRADI_3g52807v3 [Brachypodium distachyon]PNT69288.1 hypothetical protein BRADI_3g52807v3 [Brachypodium distachyon]|eukprot:XP_003570194.1 protein RADIALIS-like 4 [Brachypodium distachyon]